MDYFIAPLRTSGRAPVVDDDNQKEIARLQNDLDVLRASTVIAKHEKRELKQITRNTEVVCREFKRSLEDKKSIFDTVSLELETLKGLLAKKQKEFDQCEKECHVLQEVVDSKLKEVQDFENQITTLRDKILVNHEKQHNLEELLDSKQYREWSVLIDEWNSAGGNSITKSMLVRNKVEGRLRFGEGVPDSLRGQIWQILTPVRTVISDIELLFKSENIKSHQLYYHLLESSSTSEKVIQKDIQRSFPNEEFRHRMLEKDRIRSLFNVLKAYSNLDPSFGYCQGMNFLVGFLLLYLNQEDTFWMLCTIMYHFKMVGLFQSGKMLPYFIHYFDEEMKANLPDLKRHFVEEGISSAMFLTEWLTCMFVYNLSRGTVARLWDLFFFGNGQQELFRIGLAILQCLESDLMKGNLEEILSLTKKKAKNIPCKELMGAARRIQLLPSTIAFLNSIESQWQTNDGQRKLIVRSKKEILS
ncbi:RabGAP/TBC domain-containing protein [Planoprotostelium fungivorum]|uniref:RabGAP/TBC domain-containing protein n=1 Tax=Planoprotostelium fungivorum TaxID=1890364 RepID=A0A2P6NP10_9EUKA|nr:RabGAP/TBC domain-containing protein [Planoprotostelium fungivorum]